MEDKEIKEPKKEKAKKPNKNKELEEKLKLLEEEALRAKADLINYRKRKDEEVASLLKYSNYEIFTSLLPVIDNFERALNTEEKSEEILKYLDGFKLIYEGIKDIFEKNEVKEIDALGKKFDPLYHQSVQARHEEDKEEEIVLEVYQKGYTYKDKILRPAMVIINE